jgi:hypothetical protein
VAEKIDELREELVGAVIEGTEATRQVGPSVRASTVHNLRNGRPERRAVERSMDRTLRRKQFEGGW